MGLDKRKTSGNIIGGSSLIVPNQPVYSVKKFPPTFQYKKWGNMTTKITTQPPSSN
jgi:hypothetical protein